MSSENTNTYKTGGVRATYIMVLLCLMYLFDYADRKILGAVSEFIKQDWNLSDAQIGNLSGIVSLVISFAVIPLSFFIDRWSRRKMVSIMVVVWSLATLACAFANNYGQLMVARAFTGLGEAAYASASIAIIAVLYRPEYRARAVGIWDAFAPIGAAVGIMAGGYIGMHYGWRNSFGLLALPGFVLAILFWFTKDYKTVPLSGSVSEGGQVKLVVGFWQKIKSILKIKTLWFVFIGFAFNLGLNKVILFWIPSYFSRYYNLDAEKAGTMAGGLILLALIGAPLGGFLADRLSIKYKSSKLLISGVGSLVAGVLLITALLLPAGKAVIPIWVIFGISAVVFLGPASAVIQDVVHPGMRAIAFGINVFLMHFAGGSWSPWAIGRLSDIYGLKLALLMLPLFAIFGGISFLIGSKYYLADKKRVAKIDIYEE